jgi:late competence protein required for DNA uptake (superfamily II DNA/RNA helicase)
MVESAPKSLEKQMREAFFSKLAHSEKHLQTTVSAAVDKATSECPADFKCNICLQLVHNPEECGNCDQLFCKDCIASWRARGNSACPLCQASLNM